MDDYKRKLRFRQTNIVGGLAFGLIVVVIISSMAMGWAKKQRKIQAAENESVVLADHFVEYDLDEIMLWAEGEQIDPWGNNYILETWDQDEAVILSKGADGELNTEDDILGVSTPKTVSIVESIKNKVWPDKKVEVEVEVNKEPEEEEKGFFGSIKDRVKFKWSWSNEE